MNAALGRLRECDRAGEDRLRTTMREMVRMDARVHCALHRPQLGRQAPDVLTKNYSAARDKGGTFQAILVPNGHVFVGQVFEEAR